MVPAFAESTARTTELDADTLRGLTAPGLRVHDGKGGTAWLGKIYSRNVGLCIDVGCSERIVDGTIWVVRSDVLRTFTLGNPELADATQFPLDAVVIATGFLNPQ